MTNREGGMSDNAREIGSSFNDWFCSLPDGRQAVLREDKWMLAQASYDAGVESQRRTIEEKDREILALTKAHTAACEHYKVDNEQLQGRLMELESDFKAIQLTIAAMISSCGGKFVLPRDHIISLHPDTILTQYENIERRELIFTITTPGEKK